MGQQTRSAGEPSASGPRNPREGRCPAPTTLGRSRCAIMLSERGRRVSAPRLGAALGLLLAVPATAAAQAPLPVPSRRSAGPTVPSAPSISLPVAVRSPRPCPGARRRSGARARRVAVGCLVNKARARAGLRGFAWNRALARAATRHARDMARRGYFAHQRAGGPSLVAPGTRGRLARAPRRRGDRLRLRLARARRSRSCARGWRARRTAAILLSRPRPRGDRHRRPAAGPLRRPRRDLRARRRA